MRVAEGLCGGSATNHRPQCKSGMAIATTSKAVSGAPVFASSSSVSSADTGEVCISRHGLRCDFGVYMFFYFPIGETAKLDVVATLDAIGPMSHKPLIADIANQTKHN